MVRINADPETRREMKSGTGWAIALGILMIVLGFIALIEPFTAALAITLFMGFVFLVYGIFHVIYAFKTRKLGAGRFVLQVFACCSILHCWGCAFEVSFGGAGYPYPDGRHFDFH